MTSCHQALELITDTTIVTDVMTGRPARFIKSRLLADLVASGLPPLPFPQQHGALAPLPATGDRDISALFAGQSAALTRETTAAELVDRFGRETSQRLRAFA